jgi:hypothetical protein
VLSIAASLTPSPASQAAIVRSDRQNVLNLFAVTVRSPGRSPGSRTATQMIFLCTSIPATRGWMTSIASLLPPPDNGYGRAARGTRDKIKIL